MEHEKRNEEERQERGVYRTERLYGCVHRLISLTADVDTEMTKAKFDADVVTVHFPKPPSTKKTG